MKFMGVSSQGMMTLREVYDFDVNDEFHSRALNVPPNATRYVIIGKRISANNDTVVYTRSYNNYYSTFVSSPQPHLVYTFSSGTDSVKYAQLDSTIEYKNWPTDSCSSFWDTTYFSAQHCDAEVYEYTGSVGTCFEPQSDNRIYGRGLGMVWSHYFYPAMFVDNQWEVFYYKKDSLGIVCGTPDSTTMSVKQFVSKSVQFLVHPNPVVNKTIVFAEGLTKKSSFFVLDLTGKEVLMGTLEREKTTLDLGGLSEGIYFLKLQHGSEVLYKKIVVQR